MIKSHTTNPFISSSRPPGPSVWPPSFQPPPHSWNPNSSVQVRPRNGFTGGICLNGGIEKSNRKQRNSMEKPQVLHLVLLLDHIYNHCFDFDLAKIHNSILNSWYFQSSLIPPATTQSSDPSVQIFSHLFPVHLLARQHHGSSHVVSNRTNSGRCWQHRVCFNIHLVARCPNHPQVLHTD